MGRQWNWIDVIGIFIESFYPIIPFQGVLSKRVNSTEEINAGRFIFVSTFRFLDRKEKRKQNYLWV